MPLKDNPVWFITGGSTGLGRAMAQVVLDHGWQAVVTARNVDKIKDLAAAYDDRALALPLDVTDKIQVIEAVKAAESVFGLEHPTVRNAPL